ncbi:MAG: ribonuclease HII [Solirubrobacterales bacterium]
MGRAPTAVSGDPSLAPGSSERPSPPTGRQTASASSRETSKARQRNLVRTRRLFAFDRGLGSRFVAGADEAGRGSLAGPLVAAAVLIDYGALSRSDRLALGGLHDSKQMKPERREELFPAVLRAAARVSVVMRCARGIDDRGLHVTNLEALAIALERLAPGDDVACLVDGFTLRFCAVPHRAVIEGDGTSAAIAAASVIAKVTRDRYMHRAAQDHPGWGFEDHVGYSTPEHRAAIEQLGISPLHRRSFESVAYSQLELSEPSPGPPR